MDVSRTAQELLRAHNLGFVEASHPHIQFAFQAEGEASLDVLHGLFEGNIWSGCNQRVKMVRHNYECMQKEPSLAAIVEDSLLKQCCVGSDLKEPTALRGYSGDEVRASFLWSEPHMRSILQRPEGSFVAIICIRIRRREQGVSAFGNVGGNRGLPHSATSEGAGGFNPLRESKTTRPSGPGRPTQSRNSLTSEGGSDYPRSATSEGAGDYLYSVTSEGAGDHPHSLTSEGAGGFIPLEESKTRRPLGPGLPTQSRNSLTSEGTGNYSHSVSSEGAGDYPHSVTSEGAGGFNPLKESKNNAAFRPGPHSP